MTQPDGPRFDIADPQFWRRPLQDRMDDFAAMRAKGPFWDSEIPDTLGLMGGAVPFHAVTTYDEVVEISRKPKQFCSGQGAVAIPDMPAEAMEFFGSFINMDDPRHARQRGIVSRAFTPRRLESVLDSVATICDEVIDDFCEQGEVDLVEAMSAPFPLLVICDMMGIPRSEFKTVYDATNVILGGGDPEFVGDDVVGALFGAGMTLTGLLNEVAEDRRKNPKDDLTTALITADVEDEMMTPEELGPFFILLAVAGNDTTRTAISYAMDFLTKHPDQRRIWQDDLDGVTPTAVEEIVRYASPVVFMRRTSTEPVTIGGRDFDEGERFVMFYGAANRDPQHFDAPDTFDVRRDPNPHVGFGGPGPHFCLGAHLARRELAVAWRQLLTRLPDLEAAGPPEYLEAAGIPLVGGIKRFPVRFTPTAPVGS
jgi:methyl-branched lipid omega-hydroxylase